MANRKLTEEQEKEIKILLATNQMLADAKADTASKGKDKQVKQIENAMKENIEHIKSIDPSMVPKDTKKQKAPIIEQEDLFEDTDMSFFEQFEQSSTDTSSSIIPMEPKSTEVAVQEEETPNMSYTQTETVITDEKTFNDVDPSLQYDVIPLPSNGQVYKNKLARIPVAYLTAYDENIMTSPNLYRDGLVIDMLLKNKIVNNAINPDDLVSGDADAIILFLRSTSYGNEFPISVNDPETGEQIDTTIDLSTLKYKEFKLVSDENGHFDFKTPIKKDDIKFRYLSRKQEKLLQKQAEMENLGVKAFTLERERETLAAAMKDDQTLTPSERKVLTSALSTMTNWSKKLKEKNKSTFYKLVTTNMIAQVVAVNGNYDRDFIKKYVNSMPAGDSLALRKYIGDNSPGVDFNIEVERPESLGGGSFKTFLNWDDSVLLNIS